MNDEKQIEKAVIPRNIIWVEDDKFLSSILMKKFGVSGHNIKLAKNSLIANRIEVSDNKQKLIAGMYNTCKIYDLNYPDKVQKSIDCFKGNVTAVGFRKHDNILYTGC